MTAKGKGFGALSKLREVEQKPAPARAWEGAAKAVEVTDTWIPLGTEVRDSTKRRLKVFASQSGQTMKELTDRAINAHLDELEK